MLGLRRAAPNDFAAIVDVVGHGSHAAQGSQVEHLVVIIQESMDDLGGAALRDFRRSDHLDPGPVERQGGRTQEVRE